MSETRGEYAVETAPAWALLYVSHEWYCAGTGCGAAIGRIGRYRRRDGREYYAAMGWHGDPLEYVKVSCRCCGKSNCYSMKEAGE